MTDTAFGLGRHGFRNLKAVNFNLSAPALYEEAVRRGEGHVGAVRFARQVMLDGKLTATGEHETLQADQVFKAIGQDLGNPVLAQTGLKLEGARIATDADGLTSLPGVWAGGDCRAGGLELTVEAVEHGKRSARAMHARLMTG